MEKRKIDNLRCSYQTLPSASLCEVWSNITIRHKDDDSPEVTMESENM